MIYLYIYLAISIGLLIYHTNKDQPFFQYQKITIALAAFFWPISFFIQFVILVGVVLVDCILLVTDEDYWRE